MEYVTSVDGTPIAYESIGTGPALILVHGTASDHSRWAPLVEQIKDRFTIYAMDRRGRGGSSDGPEFSLEREYEDVVALAGSIDGPVSIYAHSYGVCCTVGAAPSIENLHRLVLYEGPNGEEITPVWLIERLEGLVADGKPEEAIITFMREALQMPGEAIEQYRFHPSWQGRVAAAPTFARELRLANDFVVDPGQYSNFNIPTLLFVGSDSRDVFVNSVEKLHAALPNSRVKRLDGQMHSADVAAPEMVAAALREFLLDD